MTFHLVIYQLGRVESGPRFFDRSRTNHDIEPAHILF